METIYTPSEFRNAVESGIIPLMPEDTYYIVPGKELSNTMKSNKNGLGKRTF